MVVKVYISGISGNKEVKKRQQRVLMILESKGVACEVVDITEPGRESEKEFMQKNSKLRDDVRYPLPPQLFNDEEYCGDYDDFDLSNEIDELEKFLKVPRTQKESKTVGNGTVNGVPGSREASAERVTETPVQESTEESSTVVAPTEEPVAENLERPPVETEPVAETTQEKEDEAEEEEEEEEEAENQE